MYFTKTSISLIIEIAKAHSKITRTMLENSYVWPPIYHDRRHAESIGNTDEPVEVRSRLVGSGSDTAGSYCNRRGRSVSKSLLRTLAISRLPFKGLQRHSRAQNRQWTFWTNDLNFDLFQDVLRAIKEIQTFLGPFSGLGLCSTSRNISINRNLYDMTFLVTVSFYWTY